jgi:prostaglandin-H2 D-isomerase / glutathione transferase
LIGSLHGLHPTDPWEAARHEALMGAIEDYRDRLGAVRRIKDPAEGKRAREELAAGYLQEFGAHVEAQVKEPFVGGAAIQVADLKLFVAQSPIRKGTMDHIPADVFKAFPKLGRQFEAVKAHPRVVAWCAR